MAQRVLADKAYIRKAWARKANRAALKGKHRDGILHKAVREGCTGAAHDANHKSASTA